MSILVQNLWRFMTVALTALLLCAASLSAFAHHHHHHHQEHHQHHASSAATNGDDKSTTVIASPKTHEDHSRHAHHHGGNCPMQIVCECGGLGCCGERYKGALARAALVDKPIETIASICKLALGDFLQSAANAELLSRKRRDWLVPFRPPGKDWRSVLYAESPRLRI